MKIQATCPACQATIAVAAENAGKRARCPKCAGAILIPGASPPRSPTVPPGKSQPRSGSASGSPRSDQPASPPGKARQAKEGEGERSVDKGRAAPQRRRKEPAADDIWSQPLSSYGSPAIEEEHYEALGIPPKSRQNRGEYHAKAGGREAGTSSGDAAPSYKIPLMMAAIGLGSAILFGAIGVAFPPAAFVGAGIGGLTGFILTLWGGIKILKNAFEVSPGTGFLYLFCGPYAIYFLFSRWDINQHPFIINLLGAVVLLVSMGVGALALAGAGGAAGAVN